MKNKKFINLFQNIEVSKELDNKILNEIPTRLQSTPYLRRMVGFVTSSLSLINILDKNEIIKLPLP